MKTKDGGATPMKEPNQKGGRGTPITGDTMLMNQLGRKGVIRRKMMQESRLPRCASTLLLHCAALSGR